MAIFGIGTDIVDITRLEAALQRHGEAFAAKLLADDELAAWREASNPAAFLAKRFAAKEAFAKALGTGIRGAVTLRRFAVVHDALGRPGFRCDPQVEAELQVRNIHTIHLSLSDERQHVVAFVVMET